jgi:ABC-type uncharacterized transport system substrate-binding protein
LITPLAAEAQPAGKVWRIGVLYASVGFYPDTEPLDRAFVQGLREHGYVVGRDLVIEFRSAYGKFDRLPGLAAELVRLPVDVIAVPGPYQGQAAKAATNTIPIVLLGLGTDPVAEGLVASLARPGGNVTGLVYLSHDLLGKRLELLKEAVPAVTRVALLVNPDWPTSLYQTAVTQAHADASRLGLRLQVVRARDPAEFAAALALMTRDRAEALMVPGDSMFSAYANTAKIVQLAAKHRLPTMYDKREYVEAGGLMTYSANLQEIYRRAAGYIDRILKGANPSEMPVEQPTTFDLMINLKTAKALGLTIPPSLLARADEVIQ